MTYIKTLVWLSIISLFNILPTQALVDDENIELCEKPASWTQDAAIFTYFKDAYYDLDVRGRAFLGTLSVEDFEVTEPNKYNKENATFLHQQAQGIIVRLGKLLPRLSHPMDFPILVEQFSAGKISSPHDDTPLAFFKVALANEMLASSADAGKDIAQFLSAFAEFEKRLLALKSAQLEGANSANLTEQLSQLKSAYRRFAGIAKQSIFSDQLAKRLTRQINAFCGAKSID